jgi:hypothetical protein
MNIFQVLVLKKIFHFVLSNSHLMIHSKYSSNIHIIYISHHCTEITHENGELKMLMEASYLTEKVLPYSDDIALCSLSHIYNVFMSTSSTAEVTNDSTYIHHCQSYCFVSELI